MDYPDNPTRLAATHGTGYDADLAVRFTYHPPEPEQPEVYEAVRDLGHLFALLIQATTASSREQSLALTHVEEAVMWANASIARRGLSPAGLAGAADLIEHAFQMLLGAKPEGRLAGALSDTSPPPGHPSNDDPWPPDGHVTGVLHPLPAAYDPDTLRAGLLALASRHGDSLAPAYQHCPACWAQIILNGQALPLPAGTQSTDYDGPDTEHDHWNGVCPFCPAYICTTGRASQRDAQEWVLDHAQQAHGKDLRA